MPPEALHQIEYGKTLTVLIEKSIDKLGCEGTKKMSVTDR